MRMTRQSLTALARKTGRSLTHARLIKHMIILPNVRLLVARPHKNTELQLTFRINIQRRQHIALAVSLLQLSDIPEKTFPSGPLASVAGK